MERGSRGSKCLAVVVGDAALEACGERLFGALAQHGLGIAVTELDQHVPGVRRRQRVDGAGNLGERGVDADA